MGSNAAGAAGPAKAAGTIVAGAVMGISWKRCVGSWYGYRALVVGAGVGILQ